MKVRILLLLLLAGALSVMGYQRYQMHLSDQRIGRARELNQQQAEEFLRNAKAGHAGYESGYFDQSMIESVPTAYPRAAPEWIANEKRFYERILFGEHYDVLVAPLQVNGFGFDRASRSVMSAELTAAIAKAQPGKVPDAYLIAKVVGEGLRQFPQEALYRLAKAVGARRIIWGAVGTDPRGLMTVMISSQFRPDGAVGDEKWSTPINTRAVINIPSDAEHPAIEAFAQRIPEMLKDIDINPANLNLQSQSGALDIKELPLTPLNLTTAEENPAREAYTFMLFSALTPAHIARTKERFAEKALLALTQLSPTAPEYRALRARAYLLMGYRAAAKSALGTPTSTEELEIQAVLDGNLPEVRAEAAKESNPMKRLIAQLDVNRIRADYDILTAAQSVDAVKALGLPGNVWPFLAARAFADGDSWSQFDNAALKAVLDQEFPLKGYGLEELLRGELSVGDTNKLRTVIDLSVFNHTQKYAEEHAAQYRDTPSSRFSELDYAELLSALGHDNLIRRIDFLTNVQRMPAAAIEYAERIQSLYEGYPYFETLRSEAERMAADDAGGAEREGLMKLAYRDVFNALYWEQSQSSISARALQDLFRSFHEQPYGPFDNFYYRDIPFHPLYPIWAGGGFATIVRANGLAALSNATSEFGAVLEVVGGDRAKSAGQPAMDAVMHEVQTRFLGSPQRAVFLADQYVQHGDPTAAAAVLREELALVPENGLAYVQLGKLMYQSAEPVEAAKIFLSYPGLRSDSSGNRVEVANIAYEMGGYFFGSGDFELAVPFYKIAASGGTGAASALGATMRLKLLDGDVDGALLSSLERAQRYHDSRAYRDYLGLLHATGHSKEAWAGFNTLVRELQAPYIWETVLVGHHVAGLTEAQVTEWARQDEYRSIGDRVSYAINYLARFATTDRVPSEKLASVITDLDRPTWQFDTGQRSVVRPGVDDKDMWVLGPADAITASGVLPTGLLNGGGPKHRVRPALSYFVEGYRDLKLGQFQEAKRVFDEAAGLYDMANVQSAYMLPYYALASAQAGSDVSGVEQILVRFNPTEQLLDYHLARAVLEAVAGKHSNALASLKLARYRRPNTEESAPLTQFTYADICENLFQITGNAEIRRAALDWARSREKAEPWQSWSYALEATLTLDSSDRQRAIAMTYYLDPNSAHLASFSKSEIEAAVRQFGSANIFLRKRGGAVGGTTT